MLYFTMRSMDKLYGERIRTYGASAIVDYSVGSDTFNCMPCVFGFFSLCTCNKMDSVFVAINMVPKGILIVV